MKGTAKVPRRVVRSRLQLCITGDTSEYLDAKSEENPPGGENKMSNKHGDYLEGGGEVGIAAFKNDGSLIDWARRLRKHIITEFSPA